MKQNKDLDYSYKILSFLGDLVAGADHEINNQLMMIEGSAHILLAPDPNPKARQMAIEAITAKAYRIQEIMAELRNVLRNGELDSLKTEDVVELTNKTINLCRSRFKNHHVVFQLNLQEGTKVECKETQLMQALLGLLNNAHASVSKASQKQIKVDVLELPSEISIVVQDSGRAFSEKELSKLFDPFFVLEDGRAAVGLALAKSIIEAHGGAIEGLNSNGLPTVKITLPKHQPEEAVAQVIQLRRRVSLYNDVLKVDEDKKRVA